ncbi:MAG: hypothetical protein ACRD23_13125 [Terriglobales bacterium]
MESEHRPVVLRGLRPHDPAQRYQTGLEMAADIRAVRERGDWVGSEDRPDDLKDDFFSRYVSGTSAEPGSLKRKSSEQIKEGTRTLRKKKAMFTLAVFLFGFSALAVEVVALWHMRASKPKQSELMDWRQVADNSGDNDTQVFGVKEPALVNPPVPSSPGPIHQAKSPPQATKASVPATNVVLQVEFEHHFANATASIWVDDVPAGTHTLYGTSSAERSSSVRSSEINFKSSRRHLVDIRSEYRSSPPTESYDQSRVITVELLAEPTCFE